MGGAGFTPGIRLLVLSVFGSAPSGLEERKLLNSTSVSPVEIWCTATSRLFVQFLLNLIHFGL